MKKSNHALRYSSVVTVFCLICVIYLSRLFYIQIGGRENTYDAGTTVREVTIQATRGEILDRNGKPLVTNRFTYDLTLTHATLSAIPVRQTNRVLLTLLSECRKEGTHEEKYFPLANAYPFYCFSEETESGDSVPYYRLQMVLKAIGLPKDATAKDITDYYVDTYSMLATDGDGNRLFDDDEIDKLIRLRYDMDAMQFGVNNDYTFAENVSLSLITRVKEAALSGVTFRENAERVYAYPGYASHILGTVGPIYSEEWAYYNEQGYPMNAIVGKTGCEYAFEQYLHGKDGKLRIEEDAAGNVVNITVVDEPVAGSDIRLTIDIDLQMAAEDGLAENVAYVANRAAGVSTGSGCRAGAAVAMDPKTFDVLAIASCPTFDLSTYNADYSLLASDEALPLLNRALNGTYAPGSTYKLGVSIAGMMEGVITPTSLLNCSGVYKRYNDYQPKCSTYGSSHSGLLNVSTAITVSCNCFYYEVGYQLGITRLDSWMSRLGVGQPTGIELGGSTGVIAGPEYRQEVHGDPWTPGLDLQAAIGQSDNQLSPLQLACYLGTIANGGTRYSAHLLSGVYAFGKSEPDYAYDPAEHILDQTEIPKQYLSAVFLGMKDMITSHTTSNRYLTGLPVTVGGKTGTAQNSSGCENALFVCAAPYNDPEIVISVVLEQGYSGEYSSITAARILETYYGVKTKG